MNKTYFDCYKKSLAAAASRKKPKLINITPEQVNKKFSKTKHNCAYTGLPTETKSGGTYRSGTGSGANPFKITIDRSDPSEGYTLSNIKPATWFANQMKGTLPASVFEAAAILVAYNQLEQFIDKRKLKAVQALLKRAETTVRRGK